MLSHQKHKIIKILISLVAHVSMSFIHSNLFRLFFPLLFIAVLFIDINEITQMVETNFNLAVQFPYLLFTICLVLCQSFNQGRMGMIAVAMGVSYWIIQTRLQFPLSYGTTKIEYVLLASTLPVAFVSVYLFPEKRFFSSSGLKFMSLMIAMLAWGALFVQHIEENGFSDVWQSILFEVPQISRLPFVIVLYNFFCLGLFGIFVLNKNKVTDVAIYIALCMSTITFVLIQFPYISTILFSIAGILLIILIMTTSHELAYLDQLTNIPGRRALETEMKHLGKKYTIAMLDVDHFKKFNDTHGHAIGDDVLKLVANQMTKIGGRAKVYRYGGEEFTVLFKGKFTDEALDYLEELRDTIANYEMALRNQENRMKGKVGMIKRGTSVQPKKVNVTISIGVADSFDTKNPTHVLKAADTALYKAKKTGRNRVSY